MPELRKGDIVTTEGNVVWICNNKDIICRQGKITPSQGRLKDFIHKIIRIERYVLPITDVLMDFGKYDYPEPQKIKIWEK